jgi:hypothetical protein
MKRFSPDSIRSMALRTDLIFHRYGGQIHSRGGYLVVRTPSNPGYFYGNMLVFPDAPRAGETSQWLRHFVEEFGATPGVEHCCFVWDGEKGDVGAAAELEDVGFELDLGVVLTATKVHEARYGS